MSSSAMASRRRAGSAGRLVRSVLLVAVLIPVTVLFVQVYQDAAEQKSFAEKERHGVTYLASLWQLTLALTEAQAGAVAGRLVDPEALPQAVAALDQIDDRLGGELRTHDRWRTLREKIDELRTSRFTNASAAYTGYTEAAEMVLGLFRKVRESSQLIRDPDADAYFLEDAVAEELPEATVAASRLADLTLMAPSRPQSERITMVATLAGVRTAVTSPAGDLAGDLRSAVDNTQSRSLSGSLLGRLDLYQRSMDRFTAVSAPGAAEVAPDATPLLAARTELHAAAAALGETIFAELDDLLVARIEGLQRRQWYAIATLALAVVLIAVPVALTYLARQRGGPQEPPPAEPGLPAAGPVRRPLVTTSAGTGTDAGGGEQPGWGR